MCSNFSYFQQLYLSIGKKEFPFRYRVLKVSAETWCSDSPSLSISILIFLSILYKVCLLKEQGLPILLWHNNAQTASGTIEMLLMEFLHNFDLAAI